MAIEILNTHVIRDMTLFYTMDEESESVGFFCCAYM